MKLIVEQWRKFLKEEEDTTVVGDFETVGDLRKALSAITRGRAATVGGKAISGAVGTAIDVGSKGVAPILRALWNKGQKDPKLAKSSKALNKLMIDPFVSKVVDDEIEIEFIKDISAMIDGKKDEERLVDMNMTSLLTKYIQKDYADVLVRPPEE